MSNQSQNFSQPFSFPPGWGEKIKERRATFASSSAGLGKTGDKSWTGPGEPIELPSVAAPSWQVSGEAGAEPIPSSEGMTALRSEEPSRFSLKKFLPLITGILVLGVVGVMVFRLVSSRRSQTPGEVVLNYWGLWEPGEVMGSVLTEWEQAHPEIKINYTQHSHREYRERVQSALARNEGPDLFRFHLSWIPMLGGELAPVPNEVMSRAEFESSYYPVAAAHLRSKNGYLGIPLEVDTLALFYNQEIFQAAGKTPPTLWGELRKVALELTTRDEKGQIQTAGVALGTTSNVEHWSDVLGLMMLQNGANLSNPTGVLAEDSLTFYTIFSLKDKVWNESLPNSLLAFATGKVAMFFGFSWDVFEIKKINPNLDFRVVPAPQLPGTDIAWASFWVEGVAKRSKHQREAWEFLKFLSSPEIMEKLYLAESRVRLFGEPYARVSMAQKLRTDLMASPFVEQASKAQTWYLCSRTWDNGINDRMIKYFEDAVNAVNGGQPVGDALKTAKDGVSQLLSQYGLASQTAR